MKKSEEIIKQYIKNPPLAPDCVEESTLIASCYSAQLALLLSAKQTFLLLQAIDDEANAWEIKVIIKSIDALIKEYDPKIRL